MKLKLEKSQVTSLSMTEMQSINGGTKKNSDRRTGDCRYSRKHGLDQYGFSCKSAKPKKINS